MNEVFTWIGYLAAPLFLVLLVLWVYRPSARQDYDKAKQIPFADDDNDASRRDD